MRPEDRTDYIVRCLMDAATMYEDGARSFLAEHDADKRSEVLNEAADVALKAVALTGSQVALGIATELRRMVATAQAPAPRRLDDDPAPQPETPCTERARWQALADALNALPGGRVGIDLDGTVTDYDAWSVVYDRTAERWIVAGYDDEQPAPAPETARDAEVAHVVADDSDDPEHVDDCPGCETTPDLRERIAEALRAADAYAQLERRDDRERFADAVLAVLAEPGEES